MREPQDLPPRWLVLLVEAPPAGEELLLIDALRRLGARAVEREGERFAAYLPPPESVESCLRETARVIRASTSLDQPMLSWRWEDYARWAERWQIALKPRRISERIVVASSSDSPELRPGDVLIRLEAGPAFGTAEHATTRTCLRYLNRFLRPGDHFADIGAGSGILTIAAVLLGAGHALALESDPLACASARRNASLNMVEDRVTVRETEANATTLRKIGCFPAMVANIGAAALIPLLPALHDALTPSGWLVLSGIVADEQVALIDAAREAGLELQESEIEEGWWSGRFERGRRHSLPTPG